MDNIKTHPIVEKEPESTDAFYVPVEAQDTSSKVIKTRLVAGLQPLQSFLSNILGPSYLKDIAGANVSYVDIWCKKEDAIAVMDGKEEAYFIKYSKVLGVSIPT
jgi:hypothetical protein